MCAVECYVEYEFRKKTLENLRNIGQKPKCTKECDVNQNVTTNVEIRQWMEKLRPLCTVFCCACFPALDSKHLTVPDQIQAFNPLLPEM